MHGGMAERTNATVLKTVVAQVTVGSNPTPSASETRGARRAQPSARVRRQLTAVAPPVGRTEASPCAIARNVEVQAICFSSTTNSRSPRSGIPFLSSPEGNGLVSPVGS